MSSPSDDEADSELSRYAPKWPRERPATPDAERLRSVGPSPSIARWSTENYQNRQIRSLRPEPLPEPPARGEDWLLPLVGRSVKVAAFAVLVALLAIFGKSLLEGVSPLNSGSQTKQVSEPSDQPPALQGSLVRRRPQLRRHKRRSHRGRGSKRRSLRPRNRSAKTAVSAVPFAG